MDSRLGVLTLGLMRLDGTFSSEKTSIEIPSGMPEIKTCYLLVLVAYYTILALLGL